MVLLLVASLLAALLPFCGMALFAAAAASVVGALVQGFIIFLFWAAVVLVILLLILVAVLCVGCRILKRQRNEKDENDSLVHDICHQDSHYKKESGANSAMSTLCKVQHIRHDIVATAPPEHLLLTANAQSLSSLEILLPSSTVDTRWNENDDDQMPPPINPSFREESLKGREILDHNTERNITNLSPLHFNEGASMIRRRNIRRIFIVPSLLAFFGILAIDNTNRIQSSPVPSSSHASHAWYDAYHIYLGHGSSHGGWQEQEKMYTDTNEELYYGSASYYYDACWNTLAMVYGWVHETFVDDYAAILLGVHYYE